MDYRALLKHPKWQKRRLVVMRRSDFECERCGDSETTLHVHHEYYIKGRMPWQYPLSALSCLCERCHEAAHGRATGVPKASRAQRAGGRMERRLRALKGAIIDAHCAGLLPGWAVSLAFAVLPLRRV